MKHPYYIVAPAYLRSSAGIRVLHLLGQSLRKIGYEAYLLTSGTNPALDTPRLTEEVVSAHARERRTPIVIYPEILEGNPLRAPMVVRYLLNSPGALGGPTRFPASEYRISYARGLDPERTATEEKVLFFPASDTSIFHPPTGPVVRAGRCFYAGKYRDVHGGRLFPLTEGCTEIARSGPQAPSASDIAELLRKSELLYCYENTALTIEATLCGCPVVLLPNEHFQSMIASEELGRDGIAWGDDPSEVERARATVDRCWRNYERLELQLWSDLRAFAQDTQAVAMRTPYDRPILFFDPYSRGSGLQKLSRTVKFILSLLSHPPSRAEWRSLCSTIRRDGLNGLKRQIKDREIRYKLR